MNRHERIELIMRTLGMKGSAVIAELMRETGVSHMTIRRDLALLEAEGRVAVRYGGIVLKGNEGAGSGESYYSLITAGAEQPERKRRIGALAATLIEADDTLIIDSGSTAEYFAKRLPEDREYTVLCYALNIVAETVRRKNVRTMFSGGIFHDNTLMFESPEGLATIRRYRATKAFITASGIDSRLGVTCMNSYERETKRAAIDSSIRKILLVDSTKFGVVRSDHFAELSEFDEIVTDAGIPEEYAELCATLGIRLRIA